MLSKSMDIRNTLMSIIYFQSIGIQLIYTIKLLK